MNEQIVDDNETDSLDEVEDMEIRQQ